jgi:hypothetical protein
MTGRYSGDETPLANRPKSAAVTSPEVQALPTRPESESSRHLAMTDISGDIQRAARYWQLAITPQDRARP